MQRRCRAVITNIWDEVMIAIINRGGPIDGVCRYTVGINERVIAEFEHNRRDGLAVCLERAADAVRDAELKTMAMLYLDTKI